MSARVVKLHMICLFLARGPAREKKRFDQPRASGHTLRGESKEGQERSTYFLIPPPGGPPLAATRPYEREGRRSAEDSSGIDGRAGWQTERKRKARKRNEPFSLAAFISAACSFRFSRAALSSYMITHIQQATRGDMTREKREGKERLAKTHASRKGTKGAIRTSSSSLVSFLGALRGLSFPPWRPDIVVELS
jgi:hypothetical protein